MLQISLRFALITAFLLGLCLSPASQAGNQKYEPLAASVQAALQATVADHAAPEPSFPSLAEKINWLTEMSRRLERRIPDRAARLDFLKTVYYEAKRAGLDPQLVLGLIQVESGFKKYAVSSAGARGYMQVMPFWVKLIGTPDNNLFHLRTNLRYGCTILRHYLDIERGDLYRALGRYNGSLGKPEYPNLVRGAWERQWNWSRQQYLSPY
ncbi:MAG: lytic transglycosylase domain-containing protein [Sterolibacterium sp.]|nr:lytic transglycosylase domain-containing protein [Sterolibacterium sp.]MBP9800103.1 lytic transglycosylase domain-containing protein [Sterolibacterium sp.]